MDVARLNQRVCTEVMLGTLENAKRAGVIEMYLAKGGMALEIRFGAHARASRDLDIGILASGADLVTLFDRALAVGYDQFTLERPRDARLLEKVATYRFTIKIKFFGRSFGSLEVDLNEASYETAVTIERTALLTAFGLPGPLEVPLLDHVIQLAHKIHGATEPSRQGYTNVRYRDVLDILIIARDAAPLDYSRLRQEVIREFERRTHHRVWPPLSLDLSDEWREALGREAEACEFEPSDGGAIWSELLRFLARVEGIAVSPTHEYRFVNLQEVTSGGGSLTAEAQAMFDALIADGWHAALFAHHRHYVDHIQVILTRTLPTSVELPRLQIRAASTAIPGQPIMLAGELRNESDHPANEVRLWMTGVDRLQRVGTLIRGDGPIPVSFTYGNERASREPLHSPRLFVEFETDGGQRARQECILDVHGPDADNTYQYTALGLRPTQIVGAFLKPYANS